MRAIIEDENAEDGVQLRVSILFEKKIIFFKKLLYSYFYTSLFTVLLSES